MNYPVLILVIGALIVGGYFVYKAVNASACAGDWTDYINPSCWLSNTASELNIVLIILALVVVVVVGLLAFGPQTQHIARGASSLALL